MKIVEPLRARVRAPNRPPLWPPIWTPLWSPMLAVIQESSPDSAMIHSWGCRSTSRTGIVVPRILYSTSGSLPSVWRLGRDDLEATVGSGQDPRSASLDDDVVFDPDAAPARDVDARLDR